MREVKVLVVDDDVNICNILRLYLEKEMYKVQVAYNGKEAMELYGSMLPDIVLLDVMMPEIDGWELCRFIRKNGNCPVIMITAKGEAFDKILGLELGADDYVSKPFEVKEVIARVKAVLRRTLSKSIDSENKIDRVEYDNLIIDISKYELIIKGQVVDIPPKEMELLFFLASNPNKVYTRNVLLDKIWGVECFVDIRTVDVHVKRLREKLEGVSENWVLKTVWGVGYKFETH